jgi:hypothetical protein
MKQQLIETLEITIAGWRKESTAYMKLAGINENSRPKDASPEQLGMAYSAATYRLCAKELNDVLKQLKEA